MLFLRPPQKRGLKLCCAKAWGVHFERRAHYERCRGDGENVKLASRKQLRAP